MFIIIINPLKSWDSTVVHAFAHLILNYKDNMMMILDDKV